MTMQTKRWVWSISISIIIGFIGLNALAYNHAWAMTHYTSLNSRTSKPEGLTLWSKMKVLLIGVNVPRPNNKQNILSFDSECKTFYP